MEGWIKLHKRLRDHGILRDDNAYKLFTVLLMYVKTDTGTYTAGRNQLGQMAHMKPITAYKALKRLEKKWKMVTLSVTADYTEIRVLNWAKYQGRDDGGNSLGNSSVTAREQLGNTKKEIRNKKKEEYSGFSAFWEAYPKKEAKKKAEDIWDRKKLDSKLPEILAFIEKAKTSDRWQRGFIKQPTTFLNQESWEDDVGAYQDAGKEKPRETRRFNNGVWESWMEGSGWVKDFSAKT